MWWKPIGNIPVYGMENETFERVVGFLFGELEVHHEVESFFFWKEASILEPLWRFKSLKGEKFTLQRNIKLNYEGNWNHFLRFSILACVANAKGIRSFFMKSI